MKKIALDFDSVLSDTMIAWTDKYNEEHSTHFTKDTITSWSFWDQEEFGFDKSYACVFFRRSWSDWKNLRPTEPDLDKTVAKLSKFGQVDVLTNVEKNHLGNVRDWLDDRNMHDIEIVPTEDKNKVKDFDYNLYIDDDPLLAKDADSENKNCFVYDQKWNSHVETSQYVSRINKLTDAIDNLSKKEL